MHKTYKGPGNSVILIQGRSNFKGLVTTIRRTATHFILLTLPILNQCVYLSKSLKALTLLLRPQRFLARNYYTWQLPHVPKRINETISDVKQ